MNLFQTLLLVSAVSAVAVGDILLKKTQASGSFIKAVLSPWMLGAIILYLFQIAFFTYLFVSGVKLVHVGIMQTVFYALIVLLAGIFLFGESITAIQGIGIALALIGVILLNL
jgi:drug/metabolite transporter (DMT)-like permease